ncbi:MAG TPA: glycogen debranching N-terminal domain-containing protein [Candidatus Limnocylindria bacterium]|nr:glycogen debranching N-terminal domain-containing protein [Candidatus Limnocylindria bacterium]
MTVSLKEGEVVVITPDDGSIPGDDPGSHGLYYHDMRFVSVFELRINGERPMLLSANGDENYVATFQLINDKLVLADGTELEPQSLSIRRTRFVADGWRERIGLLNCSAQTVTLEISLTVDADFQDLFSIRGFRSGDPAHVIREMREGGVNLTARGADGVVRATRIRTIPNPTAVVGRELRFTRTLAPQEVFAMEVRLIPSEDDQPPTAGLRDFDEAIDAVRESYKAFLKASTEVRTSRERLDRELLERSARDLRALLDFEPTGPYPTAGIPWYATPFGRDGIIAGLQSLSFNPDVAVGTLRLLARHQGKKVDPFTEEEPGKILHELRRGELARLGRVPHRPYYGTVDATPLFVSLFVDTVRWLGDWSLYRELLGHADAALRWCDTFGDPDRDGFVEYGSTGSGVELRNKGWKDSRSSLSYRDGSLAELPAALVEVQSYVYHAKRGMAELASLDGDAERASRLHQEAEALREHFEDAFWMPAERCYAQALDAAKRQVDAVTSNAGHALWAGIASAERGALVAKRLMERDMFSGWGVRTLSSSYPTYNPMSYHNGSVWPHDNSLIAAGFAAYGQHELAHQIITAIVDAGLRFPNARLPELFCGFFRDQRFANRPADYLVSCIPQAWAAGSPLLFVQTILGLRPELASRELRVDPHLPDWLERVDVEGLRALGRRYTFRVRRTARGIRVSGDLRRPAGTPVAATA